MYLLDTNLYEIMNLIVPEDSGTVIHAVIEKIQDGHIYVDNTEEPRAYSAKYIGGVLCWW